jgi:hypothetical protein
LEAITPKQALKVPDHNRDSVIAQGIMVSKDKFIVMKSSRSAEALRRIFREKNCRIFICEEDENGEWTGELEYGEVKQCPRQKLVGLESKTELLNIGREREEFDK